MITERRSFFSLKISLDLLLLAVSFLLAAVLAQSPDTLLQRPYMFALLAVQIILWYFHSIAIAFYEDFQARNFSFQFIKIIRHTLLQTMTAVFFIFVVKEDLFTRNFILIFALSLPFLISLRVIIVKELLKNIKTGTRKRRSLLIIGDGEVARNFAGMINADPGMGYDIVGFIAEDRAKNNQEDVIGTADNLEDVLNNNDIHEAIIALPQYASDALDTIIRLCNKYAVRTHIIPDYFKFLSKKFQVGMLGNFPIITVREEPLEQLHWRLLKRAFDLLFSLLFALLIVPWFFPAVIIAIKLSSKGPAFYNQKRVGKDNKIFTCFKFRTMYLESDKKGFTPTEKDDQRITPIGRLLRKTNIDELPQIINVLLGDMSFVGPRPHALAYNDTYKEFVEEIKLRHLVKPGITGWAQVHGLRGDAVDERENKVRIRKRIAFDIWYIENWSLLLDIQIILLTVWQMITGKIKGH